ncbi:MAG: hypothetical protein C5B52_11045 [Bacteroidetes bacterium]|nr:MAG: hypothetical protein C5B52_11045 [Bacteroidota bacterium]
MIKKIALVVTSHWGTGERCLLPATIKKEWVILTMAFRNNGNSQPRISKRATVFLSAKNVLYLKIKHNMKAILLIKANLERK